MRLFTTVLFLLLGTFSYGQLKKKSLKVCNDLYGSINDSNKFGKNLARLDTVIVRFDKRLFGQKNSNILSSYRTSAISYHTLKVKEYTTKNPCAEKPNRIEQIEKYKLDTFPTNTLIYEAQFPKSKVDQVGKFLTDLSARAHLIDTINYVRGQKSYEALIDLVNNTNALREESQQSWCELLCQFYLEEKIRLKMAKNQMEQNYIRAVLKFSKH